MGKLQILKVRVKTLRVSETVEKHAFLARAPKATTRTPWQLIRKPPKTLQNKAFLQKATPRSVRGETGGSRAQPAHARGRLRNHWKTLVKLRFARCEKVEQAVWENDPRRGLENLTVGRKP